VEVELSFDRSPGRITDLASGGSIPATERWNLTLGAYELRSVAVGPEVEVTGFTAVAPREVAEALAHETDTVLAAFEKVRALGRILPGMDEMEAGIRSALSEGRLAWLRRALTSYAARKSVELAKA
jgi:hypothetical protein